MRITAHFYTTDEAERAASAIRNDLSGVFDVTINSRTEVNSSDNKYIFGALPGTLGERSIPVPLVGLSDGRPATDNGADVEVICRASESKRISGILINRGGHELRGS
ncbi:MAG: hypothetical protein ACI4KF_09765 [Huintestinicola sp.]